MDARCREKDESTKSRGLSKRSKNQERLGRDQDNAPTSANGEGPVVSGATSSLLPTLRARSGDMWHGVGQPMTVSGHCPNREIGRRRREGQTTTWGVAGCEGGVETSEKLGSSAGRDRGSCRPHASHARRSQELALFHPNLPRRRLLRFAARPRSPGPHGGP